MHFRELKVYRNHRRSDYRAENQIVIGNYIARVVRLLIQENRESFVKGPGGFILGETRIICWRENKEYQILKFNSWVVFKGSPRTLSIRWYGITSNEHFTVKETILRPTSNASLCVYLYRILYIVYRVRVYVRVHLYIHVPRDEDNGESLLDVCIRIYLPAGGHKSPKPGKSHITRENIYIYILTLYGHEIGYVKNR